MRFGLMPVVVSAMVLSVAGCGGSNNYTSAQMEASRLKSIAVGYRDASDNCQQKIAGNPDYAPLKLKTTIDTTPFSLQMLNDKTSPNKNEIALLYRVYADVQECRKFLQQSVAETLPSVLNPLAEYFAELTDLAVGYDKVGVAHVDFVDVGFRDELVDLNSALTLDRDGFQFIRIKLDVFALVDLEAFDDVG
jgi:hypothetical protein